MHAHILHGIVHKQNGEVRGVWHESLQLPKWERVADRNRENFQRYMGTASVWEMRQVSVFSVIISITHFQDKRQSKEKLWPLCCNSAAEYISTAVSSGQKGFCQPQDTHLLIHVGTIYLTNFLLFFSCSYGFFICSYNFLNCF